jgi:hypothetical protein
VSYPARPLRSTGALTGVTGPSRSTLPACPQPLSLGGSRSYESDISHELCVITVLIHILRLSCNSSLPVPRPNVFSWIREFAEPQTEPQSALVKQSYPNLLLACGTCDKLRCGTVVCDTPGLAIHEYWYLTCLVRLGFRARFSAELSHHL